MTKNTKGKTFVTFKSSVFNTSQQREYFINPGCFGDDVANWFIRELRRRDYQTDDAPGQEDFGWYFRFRVSAVENQFVIGYRPGDREEEAGTWFGCLERRQGLVGSIFGARKTDIDPATSQLIHSILSSSSNVRDVRWYFERDFMRGREELHSAEP